MDPKTWSNDGPSALERQLLEAARGDRVPDALSARMAEGLGLEVGAAVSGSFVGAKVATPLFAKTGLWGVLSLGLIAAAGAWYATRSTPAVPQASGELSGMADEPAAAVAQAPDTEPSGESAAQAAVPLEPSADTAAPESLHVAAQGHGDALRAEVALLARARQALQQRAGARALRLLDQHARRFAHGTLAPEAAALRIEALVQAGSVEQAREQTRQFVASYPSHPLRAHVAELLAGLADPPPRRESAAR